MLATIVLCYQENRGCVSHWSLLLDGSIMSHTAAPLLETPKDPHCQCSLFKQGLRTHLLQITIPETLLTARSPCIGSVQPWVLGIYTSYSQQPWSDWGGITAQRVHSTAVCTISVSATKVLPTPFVQVIFLDPNHRSLLKKTTVPN